MLDPLIIKAFSIGFGVLFLAAGLHKIVALHEFRATLSDYQLLPESLLPMITRVVPVVEVLLGGSWFASYYQQQLTALATAALLCSYAFAIGINLYRGRIHIDCGCSFGGKSTRTQLISGGLVVRNLVLASIALLTLLPATSRTLKIGDYILLLAIVIAGALVFAATNQLIANRASINTWRK